MFIPSVSGKTALRFVTKTAQGHIVGLRLSYKAGTGPKRGMGWPMCPHAAELMVVPLSTSPPQPFGQHHISDTF